MNFSEIGDLACRSNLNDITKPDSQIFSDDFVHSNLAILEFIVYQGNNQGFFSLFAFNKNGIPLENFQFVHFGLR